MIDRCRDAYDLGCQGPDIFFFHLTRVRSIAPISMHKLGNLIHETNIEKFFKTAAYYIQDANAGDKEILSAYFMGYLTHYALDSECHAYVKYFCGHRRQHAYFETLMDLCLLEYKGIDRAELPHYKLVRVSGKTRAAVARFYSDVVAVTHEQHVGRERVAAAIRRMYRIERFLRDKSGFKSFVTKRLERIAHKRRGAYSSIIYPKNREMIDCLNLSKQAWIEPWGSDERYESFPELMDRASQKGAEYCELFVQGLPGAMTPLLTALGGLSYVTGYDWRMELTEKHTKGLLS